MWLTEANPIAIDTENHDPELEDKGPGYCRNAGFVCGISMAARNPATGLVEGFYFPVAHARDNLDKALVKRFVQSVISSSPKTLVFANATYDIGWLTQFGITGLLEHTIRDVQVAEPLLDEEKISGYSLETLSQEYLGRGKAEQDLQALDLGPDYKKKMAALPARYVGKYAEMDAINTYEIYFKQIPRLKEEQLWQVFEIESDVTKICHHMTMTGVRVSTQKAEEAIAEIDPIIRYLSRPLKGISINSSDEVGAYLARAGVDLPKLASGRVSTKKEFLNACHHKEAKRIITLRNLTKLKNDFLINGILGNTINGRIHSFFHQLRGDLHGTVTGRFSSSQPNLQQVPKRSKLSKIIRACYIPEDGEIWMQADYSSQEPRMQVHFGLIHGFDGAKEARDFFINETPKGRKLYHFFMERIPGLTYDQAKAILLGRSYGMGVEKMARSLGCSVEEARDVLDTFDRMVPYIKQLSNYAAAEARANGFVRTILGRKRRFNSFVPDHKDFRGKDEGENEWRRPVFGLAAAEKKFKHYLDIGYKLVPAGTNKAFNAKIQGSSADQTKASAVAVWRAGLGKHFRLTVHDELDSSVPNEKVAKEIQYHMENTIQLYVPTVADVSLKSHW